MTLTERSVFGPEHADVYELVYRNRGKDWRREADDVARIIRERAPGAASVLDVACGTGAHLERLRETFSVAGLEIAPAMRDRARARLPDVSVHAGDMRDFDLDRQFDAVTCLFTAIAYLETVAEMRVAVGTMARHLTPGGVLLIEPWWLPERFLDGYAGGDLVRDGERVVARVSHTRRRGRAAHMDERWSVAGPDGIETFAVTEVFTLFTEDEYRDAVGAAGCTVEFLPEWITGRGLFVGQRRHA